MNLCYLRKNFLRKLGKGDNKSNASLTYNLVFTNDYIYRRDLLSVSSDTMTDNKK